DPSGARPRPREGTAARHRDGPLRDPARRPRGGVCAGRASVVAVTAQDLRRQPGARRRRRRLAARPDDAGTAATSGRDRAPRADASHRAAAARDRARDGGARDAGALARAAGAARSRLRATALRDASPQGAGAMTLNVSDFPFAWYVRTVHAKITERWAGRAIPGQQPVAVFDIGRDGRISGLAIEKSSGNTYYDQAALRAITEAAPFPPLPAEFGGQALGVKLGFHFPERG